MKILVCIKQVPHVEGIAVKQDIDGMATLEALGAFRMNHFDEFAVEQAIHLKESMCGQVGPMTAALLDLPYATQVIGMQLARNQTGVSIEREIEGGARELVSIPLPALLTVQPGINMPRYPSLSNLLRANKQALEIIPTHTLEPSIAQVHCLGFRLPAHERASQVITGSAVEKAAQMAEILKAKALI